MSGSVGDNTARASGVIAAASSADMVKIASFNGTGASGTIEVSGCFSADYRQYQIRAMLYNDNVSQNYVQWYDATAAAYRTSSYFYIVNIAYLSTGPSSSNTTGRLWDGAYQGQSENNSDSAILPMVMITDVFEPFDSARNTAYKYDWGSKDATHYRTVNGFGANDANLSFTGFKIYTGSGNYRTQSHGAVYGIKS